MQMLVHYLQIESQVHWLLLFDDIAQNQILSFT